MSPIDPSSEKSLWRDWRMLCEMIGERRAGSKAEARAAAYIAGEMSSAGLAGVREEDFPCLSLRWARTHLAVRESRGWRRVAANPLVGAPGTPGGRVVEGEMGWLEMPESADRLVPGCLRGKVAVIFGPLPERAEQHRRLIAAGPAAVIHVDERLPFEWAKSDGVYPHWTRRHGMPPTVAVPYQAAWRWRLAGSWRVRVGVQVSQVRARSQNVIGELPGRDPRLPAVLVTAHHDTQCGNPGADDNASGVVCVLALARLLAGRRHARTIRFISFGAEEQLSVGAAAYARAHRRELRRTSGLVVNLDSVSSPLGHFQLLCAGAPALGRRAAALLATGGLDVGLRHEISPFVDNFPFNRAGVPSLCLMRTNTPGGRWQHHGVHDVLGNCSVAEVQRLLRAVFPLIGHLAGQRLRSFGGLPPEQRRAARSLGRELYGP